ncbi:APC family permease [Alicyclobacillus tolerans]|uniref:APC family permease n=1 Tax=Alicyclobacillus tolerans TaxID=90970 RepID=UPI001F15E531|nr:APC family permease [Alicyclobacillus tolerans]MCF8564033.1 APC family permease [Alicyclobacillus tolerans]
MSELKKGLSTADQVVLGISGTVGTGVLFSTAGMAAIAGPGVVLAWILGGVMYTFVVFTYVELGQLYPEAGGPARYSLYTYGRVTNLINAFSNLIWYLFIPPIEALAIVEGVNYFWPHLINSHGNPTALGGILGAVFLLIFVPFNYFGVKSFARSTNLLGVIKLILYILAAIGFVTFAHFANFTHFGGFMPFGMNGVWAAIPLGMFAYGGIRVIVDYSEEIKRPEHLRRSLMWVIIGQTLVYVLFAVAFVVSLNWSQLKLQSGAWGSISHIAGNPFLTIAGAAHASWLIPVTIAIALIGPFVTGYIYQGAGSRVLFAMSRSGLVSSRLKEIHQEYSIPAWALVVLAVIGAVLAYISSPLPSIYSLINDAVVAGYIAFATNPVIMMALRRAGRPTKLKGGSVIAVIAFAVVSLIIYWSGWPSVPYAVLLLAIGSVVFGIIYKIREGFANAIWYIVYILFMTLMTYIGGVGAQKVFNVDTGSIIVILVSVLIFLPWGAASRLKEPLPGPKESGNAQ